MGVNLSDPVFRGIYHGKRAHDDDLEQVVQRALDVGCQKMMVTGSSLVESQHAVDLAKQYGPSIHSITREEVRNPNCLLKLEHVLPLLEFILVRRRTSTNTLKDLKRY